MKFLKKEDKEENNIKKALENDCLHLCPDTDKLMSDKNYNIITKNNCFKTFTKIIDKFNWSN